MPNTVVTITPTPATYQWDVPNDYNLRESPIPRAEIVFNGEDAIAANAADGQEVQGVFYLPSGFIYRVKSFNLNYADTVTTDINIYEDDAVLNIFSAGQVVTRLGMTKQSAAYEFAADLFSAQWGNQRGTSGMQGGIPILDPQDPNGSAGATGMIFRNWTGSIAGAISMLYDVRYYQFDVDQRFKFPVHTPQLIIT